MVVKKVDLHISWQKHVTTALTTYVLQNDSDPVLNVSGVLIL